jgi:murein DD-endopeptidase MepM/ murein hydrolase activator NlpD
MHTGTDFAGACGTPVLAAGSGTVTESGWHPYGGGQRIVIDHGGGLQTTYNHLGSLGTTVGQKIDRADTIGAVGTTGNSTGCHLHFEVVVDGKTVDPSSHL